MASLTAMIAVLLLSIVTLLPEPSSAAFVLSVTPYTYRNEQHKVSNGYCCESYWRSGCKDNCDNIFTFCLRGANIRDDCHGFRFYSDEINFNSILRFYSRQSWPGSATLYVRITDYDRYSRDDHVGNIYVPIRLKPGESIRRKTYRAGYGRFDLSIQLSCQPNYFDRDCSTFCDLTDDETGHFRCGPRGERICLDGWRDPGHDCLKPICEECNPIGGICTAPGRCKCRHGWRGTQCKECTTLTGCSMEGGYCTRPGECRCHKDYGGDNCEVDLVPCNRTNPCQSGATCINDGHGGYTCTCSSGYGGRNCTTLCEPASNTSCVIECHNITNPCENGGICQAQNGTNRSSCACRQGFSGDYCEINVDDCLPNPCRNGGTCQYDNSTSTYMCTCAEGYTGPHCDVDIYCGLTQPCQNNGTCINLEGSNYTCQCTDGWTGQNCHEERDECKEFEPCKHGANCTDFFDDYKCDCVPGYMGRDCEQEIDECSPNPCINGNCTDLFNNYTCQCFDKFRGKNCEIDLNSCRSAPCQNGGSCENEPDGFYVCTCPPGYTGFNCDSEIAQRCLSSPCNNQGTCIDEEGDYYCICPPGFTGRDCSIFLNAGVAVRQNQGGVAMEAIVGGVIGAVILLLLLVAIVVVAVYLLQKKKSNQYKAMSAVVYSVNGDSDGYDNPTYESDVRIREPRQPNHAPPSDLTYSTLGNSQTTPLIAGAEGDDDQFGVDYRNFDNPLYAESRTVAESPTYSRTELPGPRGPTSNSRRSAVGNGRSPSNIADVSSSAVPGPVEYSYVGVNQQAAAGGGDGGNGAAMGATDRLQQEDGIYELLIKDDDN